VAANQILKQTIHTPIGRLLACAVDDGLLLLEFEDRPGLTEKLGRCSQKFDRVISDGKHILLTRTAQELDRYFAGEKQAFTVPRVRSGTPFEENMWDTVAKIPFGETRTYAHIASAMGKPSAARAVGRANGRNPLAIIVPCHRLIGSDGKMHGYGGGLWRKEWLLHFEQR
jgi:O-6-methylguanine DNA methyltransferase